MPKTPVNQHSMNRTALQVKGQMLYLYIDTDIVIDIGKDIDIDIDDCFLPCDLVELLQHAVAKGSPLKCVSQGVLHVAPCGSSFYGKGFVRLRSRHAGC